MRETQIGRLRERLILEASERMSKPRTFVQFAGMREADEMLNDVDGYPHAFVVACIMDRQMKAERVWRIPYDLKHRLGSFRFSDLANLSLHELEKAMKHPTPLHRFPDTMARNVHSAVRRIASQYQCDASAIWADSPSSATIVRRFLEFAGVGQKIATMAANILVRDLRVPVSDRYSIDISVDVQVRRVFSRMGFVPDDASEEYIAYRARELHPEYPGIFDLILWELGRTVCRSKQPVCDKCHWCDLCAYAAKVDARYEWGKLETGRC